MEKKDDNRNKIDPTYNMDYCSRCGTDLNDIKVVVTLGTQVFRNTEFESWEKIANLSTQTQEIICDSCFTKFAETIDDGMNEDSSNSKIGSDDV